MNEFDKLSTAISNFATSVSGMVDAMVDFAIAVLTYKTELDIVFIPAIYKVAAKDHGDWVHRANFSKKKRIRKKYHDKIMRMYGSILNR